ncbi:MAG: hypothetical protein Q8L05_09065 [Actinomycetota bacterium]|nr:hypothetical protein [Actinomycetota bacterium]MDP2287725.1 hypothetical protein [Actinomycetota bacterium]
MQQSQEMQSRVEMIPAQEINALAVCPDGYLKQAIWWTRLAVALDVLVESLQTADLPSVAQDKATRFPHVADQANALKVLTVEALDALASARSMVSQFAGVSEEAGWMRDRVRWICLRIQFINHSMEDLILAEGACRVPTSRVLRLVVNDSAIEGRLA